MLVITGAPKAFHLTPVNVAVVAVPVAGCFNISTKLLPDTAVGIVKVQVVAEVKVAVSIVPEAIDKDAAAPTVPEDCSVSE